MIYVYRHPENNFGDNCSPFIVASLLPKQEQLKAKKPDGQRPVLLALGSVLQKYPLDQCIVWGAGCMWTHHSTTSYAVRGTPAFIAAVRGPHTRRVLHHAGLRCPPVYGDPGLLLPRFVAPSQTEKYKVGIVPHVVDWESDWVKQWRDQQDVCIIDLSKSISDVINDITSCKVILSSALHGIVTADAYGIPSLWIKLSTNVLGHGFKFRDYFASIHQSDCNRVIIKPETKLQTCVDRVNAYQVNLDTNKLVEAFPYKGLRKLTNDYPSQGKK